MMIRKIRAVIFFIGWNLNGILILPFFMIIGACMTLKMRRRFIPYWCKLSLWWMKVACKITYKIEGLENIQLLEKQPMLVLSKHQSTFETFLLASMLPPHAFVIKRELLWIPIFGWTLYLMGAIPIDRSEGGKSFKTLVKLVKKNIADGISIVIFPEGTRVKIGDSSQYKKGAFILASMLKTPILPISLNSGQVWAKGQFLKNPGTINVIISKPIEVIGKTTDQIMQQTKEILELHANDPISKS